MSKPTEFQDLTPDQRRAVLQRYPNDQQREAYLYEISETTGRFLCRHRKPGHRRPPYSHLTKNEVNRNNLSPDDIQGFFDYDAVRLTRNLQKAVFRTRGGERFFPEDSERQDAALRFYPFVGGIVKLQRTIPRPVLESRLLSVLSGMEAEAREIAVATAQAVARARMKVSGVASDRITVKLSFRIKTK